MAIGCKPELPQLNTHCLRCSVWACGAVGLMGRRAAAVTSDFTACLDLMQR
jgi:hypothetical protein